MPKDRYDVWMANLGPIDHLSKQGNVTLLCHCDEDEAHCHRHLLKELIERSNG